MKRDVEHRISQDKPRIFWLVSNPSSMNQAGYDVYTYEPTMNIPGEECVQVMEISKTICVLNHAQRIHLEGDGEGGW